MKAGLVIGVNVILSVAGVAKADECHNLCADVKNSVSFKSGCSAFRNSLPRPKVARYCQEGFRAAVDTNCYDACLNGGRLQTYLTDRRLDEVCYRALKVAPRPLCHDACVRGYRSGAEDMSAALLKRMAQAAPSVLESLIADVAAQQAAQSTPATVAADSTLEDRAKKSATSTTAVVTKATEAVFTKATEPVFTRATEPVITKAAEPVVTKVEGETRETPTEEDNADYEGREPVEELVPAPKEYEEIWLVEEEKEGLPVAMGKDEKTEENEAVVDGVKSSFSMIGEEEGAGQDEGIDKDIEQGGIMLSLPIAVDDVNKELVIRNSDDPTEVVLAFCAENMPDEGEDCVDYLLRAVQAKLDQSGAPDAYLE